MTVDKATVVKHLPDLLDALRQDNYAIGIDEYVKVHHIALSTAVNEQYQPEEESLAEQLGLLLGPIVCQSPEEQARLNQHIQQWQAIFLKPIVEPHTPERPVWQSALAIVFAVTAFFIFFTWVIHTLDLTGHSSKKVNSSSSPTPIANTEEINREELQFNEVSELLKQSQENISNEITKQDSQPEASLTTKQTSQESTFSSLINYLWLGSVFLLLMATLLWRSRLVRGNTNSPINTQHQLNRHSHDLSISQTLRKSLQHLRQHEQVESNVLDIPETIKATIQQAGFFAPITSTRPQLPEYVVLIEQHSLNDHNAKLNNEWLKQFVHQGMVVTPFWYRQAPWQYMVDENNRPINWLQLQTRFSEYRLIIIGEAENWFNSIDGQLNPHANDCQNWKKAALLTSKPLQDWSRNEWHLHETGLTPFPLTDKGIQSVSDFWSKSDAKIEHQLTQYNTPFPRILTKPDVLREVEPYGGYAQNLIDTLKDYLTSKQFELLCYCALYPELKFGLTLKLARTLQHIDLYQFTSLNGLSLLFRLPWFKKGFIPDYLRIALLSQLTRTQLVNLRTVLLNILQQRNQPERKEKATESLTIHKAPPSELRKKFTQWKKENTSHLAANNVVFEKIMFGYSPKQLSTDKGLSKKIAGAASLLIISLAIFITQNSTLIEDSVDRFTHWLFPVEAIESENDTLYFSAYDFSLTPSAKKLLQNTIKEWRETPETQYSMMVSNADSSSLSINYRYAQRMVDTIQNELRQHTANNLFIPEENIVIITEKKNAVLNRDLFRKAVISSTQPEISNIQPPSTDEKEETQSSIEEAQQQEETIQQTEHPAQSEAESITTTNSPSEIKGKLNLDPALTALAGFELSMDSTIAGAVEGIVPKFLTMSQDADDDERFNTSPIGSITSYEKIQLPEQQSRKLITELRFELASYKKDPPIVTGVTLTALEVDQDGKLGNQLQHQYVIRDSRGLDPLPSIVQKAESGYFIKNISTTLRKGNLYDSLENVDIEFSPIPLVAVSQRGKERFQRSLPVVSVGTLGHVDHGKTTLTAALAKVATERNKNSSSSNNTGRSNILGSSVSHVEFDTEAYHYLLVDAPGHRDLVKGLITGSFNYNNAILVVSAEEGPMPQTREQLVLANKVGIERIIVFINKVDLVNDKEVLLVEREIRKLLYTYGYPGDTTPIIKGSALMALEGKQPKIGEKLIGKLINTMDGYFTPKKPLISQPFLMPIEDVFSIKGRGTVATGRIAQGIVKTWDQIEILGLKEPQTSMVASIEMFRKLLDEGRAGDNVGLLLKGVAENDISRGQVLSAPGSIQAHKKFTAEIYMLAKDEGGRSTPFFRGYRAQFYFRTTDVTGAIELPESVEMVLPGDNMRATITLVNSIAMKPGLRFAVREGGRTVGAGVVTKVIE